MSNIDYIHNRLREDREVYLKDDFYGIALRLFPGEDGATRVFRKQRGDGREEPVSPTNTTVVKIQLSGVFISEEEYQSYR